MRGGKFQASVAAAVTNLAKMGKEANPANVDEEFSLSLTGTSDLLPASGERWLALMEALFFILGSTKCGRSGWRGLLWISSLSRSLLNISFCVISWVTPQTCVTQDGLLMTDYNWSSVAMPSVP